MYRQVLPGKPTTGRRYFSLLKFVIYAGQVGNYLFCQKSKKKVLVQSLPELHKLGDMFVVVHAPILPQSLL